MKRVVLMFLVLVALASGYSLQTVDQAPIVPVMMYDSTTPTTPKTGLAVGVVTVAYAKHPAGTPDGTLITITTLNAVTNAYTAYAGAAYTSVQAGWVESGNGLYWIHLPKAACTGAAGTFLVVTVNATGALQISLCLQLDPSVNVNLVKKDTPFNASTDPVTTVSDDDVTAIKTKTDFLPSATAGLAGGLFIAGANNADVSITAITPNYAAFTLIGDGTGAALICAGGATGPGISAYGGGNSANAHGMILNRGGVLADDLKLTNSDAPTLTTPIAAAVWNSLWTSYTTQNSFGRLIKQIYDKVMSLR